MRLTILGSSGKFATLERACAGYLLETDQGHLLIDIGSGAWQRLLGQIDHRDLNGVVLSHRHPDHTTDLFQLFHARQYSDTPSEEPIPLWAPAETLERVTGYAPDLDESFDIRPVAAGGAIEAIGTTIQFFEMAHPCETVGMRIQANGLVVAYSSDTGPDADLLGLASGADIFLCEATFQEADAPWEGHMSAADAARAATAAQAKNLVLTHLPPDRDYGLSLAEAERASEVPVRLATDGLSLVVGE